MAIKILPKMMGYVKEFTSFSLSICLFYRRMGDTPSSWSLPRSVHPAPTPLPIIPLCAIHRGVQLEHSVWPPLSSPSSLLLSSPLLTEPLLPGAAAGLFAALVVWSGEPHWTRRSSVAASSLRVFLLWTFRRQIKIKTLLFTFPGAHSSSLPDQVVSAKSAELSVWNDCTVCE